MRLVIATIAPNFCGATCARSERVPALPVEYIVETTAKCNLYCPMCPRETHKQPKEDMTDEIFERLVQGAAQTGEHMMLIGLGEPFLDRKIFDRIEYCEQHGISTLLSTNGTLLDEKTAAKLLDSPLAAHHAELRRRVQGNLRALSQGREVRKSPRQLRALRADEARARIEAADRGADGAHARQRA